MDFSLNDHQKLIRDTVRQFMEAEVRPFVKEMEKAEKFPAEAIKKLGEMGCCGMLTPEEWGGPGLDTVSYVLMLEEVARVFTPSAVDIAAKTRATSSIISTYETVSSPGPPHSSGTSIPQQPISPSFLIAAAGNFSSRSHSFTNGRTSASMNWRTVSRISFWWSFSEKSIV